MNKVATLTLNPAVDISTTLDHLTANHKLRCEAPLYEPGGGGINIAIAMAEIGCPSTAIFPCGGPSGDILKKGLQKKNIEHHAIETHEWTRMNLAVREEASGDQYRFVMPGPQLQRSEINACLQRIISDATPEYIALSGSLPRGTGPDLIGEIADLARNHQIRLCIDTSGEPLREAVRQGVFLLKPNMRELGTITNENLSTEAGQEKALRSLIDEGRCELIVLSLGAAGVLMATSDGVERVRAPTVPINSRVGAGDSMVAGILTGLCRGYPLPKAVRLGVAAGSAAVMTPGTQLCRRKETEELFDEMTNQIGF